MIGLNDGTIAAVLLAAAHPELCRSLVLFTLTSAHTLAAGQPMESIEEVLEMIQANAVTDESGYSSLSCRVLIIWRSRRASTAWWTSSRSSSPARGRAPTRIGC